jgi:predicted metal-binding protein
MKKFMVLYMAPAAGMQEWMKKPEAERKDEEAKMQSAWNEWVKAHSAGIKETNALGKTKRLSRDAVTDTANDLMLYSIIEAESPEAAAETFKAHPHFGIPGATIEIMPVRPM